MRDGPDNGLCFAPFGTFLALLHQMLGPPFSGSLERFQKPQLVGRGLEDLTQFLLPERAGAMRPAFPPADHAGAHHPAASPAPFVGITLLVKRVSELALGKVSHLACMAQERVRLSLRDLDQRSRTRLTQQPSRRAFEQAGEARFAQQCGQGISQLKGQRLPLRQEGGEVCGSVRPGPGAGRRVCTNGYHAFTPIPGVRAVRGRSARK
jgi:hypothetical protein